MKDPLLINHDYHDSPFGPNGSRTPSRSTISTSESGQELWPVGVKLGIVRLGHAAGKLKYTLVDEQDIVLAREYTFEARLEVDLASGSGAVVFAYAYLTRQSRHTAILLQDLIWRRHNGPIPDRKRVVHRNHISMDNRLDNLCLIDIRNAHVWYTRTNVAKSATTSSSSSTGSSNSTVNTDKSSANDLHLTLYWAAIQQLPPETQSSNSSNSTSTSTTGSSSSSQANEPSSPPPSTTSSLPATNSPSTATATTTSPDSSSALSSHHSHNHQTPQHRLSSSSVPKCYDSDGNPIDTEDGVTTYYECHYPPCVRIEREPREFSICGRCQETRYCGTMCQQLDWPHHKRHCRTKSSRRAAAPYWSHRWESLDR